jgi:CelD/BcsL family acetyltransferase involved in cellulose biosynthesis
MILTTSDPVCIARDPASLEAEWSELSRRRADPTVFLTPDWIRVARTYDRREQVTLSVADRGIAALAREDDGTISFAGGEYTDYQDIVAQAPDVPLVAESLAEWIAAHRSPRVLFEFVPEDSGTADALGAALAGAGYDVRIDRLVTAPRMTLPDSFETYVQGLGKKKRHELRRKLGGLERGRRVAFRFAHDSERTSVFDRFVALHRSSRGDKAEFMTEEMERFFRDLAEMLASRGWLRLGVVTVDGEDAAVVFAFAYERTFALYNAAYDLALAPLSVGIAGHAYAIRAAIAEGMRTYDFLRGGEPYKYALGATDRWLLRLEASRR